MKKYRIRKGSPLWWSGIAAAFAVIVGGTYSWMLLMSVMSGAM